MILCFLFIEATNHDEIEININSLLKWLFVISGQLQLSDTVAKFVKWKSCQNKFYKSLDDSDISLEDIDTGQKKAEEYILLYQLQPLYTDAKPRHLRQLPLHCPWVPRKMPKLLPCN